MDEIARVIQQHKRHHDAAQQINGVDALPHYGRQAFRRGGGRADA